MSASHSSQTSPGRRPKSTPSSPGRLSASKLLPIMGLAAATGLYCGVQQTPQQQSQPTASRPQEIATAAPSPTIKVACDTNSLIAAINTANAAGGAHTLNLACSCLYDFTTANNYWYGANALPPITSDITIDGGAGGATIRRSGTNNMRLFYVAGTLAPAPSAGTLTLRRVRLTGGKAVGGSSMIGGGGGLGARPVRQGRLLPGAACDCQTRAAGAGARQIWPG